MNTLANDHFDAIENLITKEDVRIVALNFHPELDMMLIILNTGRVLCHELSAYPLLRKVGRGLLQQYKLIGRGSGVHWPLLLEDLSLKGFLLCELRKIVKVDKVK